MCGGNHGWEVLGTVDSPARGDELRGEGLPLRLGSLPVGLCTDQLLCDHRFKDDLQSSRPFVSPVEADMTAASAAVDDMVAASAVDTLPGSVLQDAGLSAEAGHSP